MKVINNDKESKNILVEITPTEQNTILHLCNLQKTNFKGNDFVSKDFSLEENNCCDTLSKEIRIAQGLKSDGVGYKHKSPKDTPCKHCSRVLRGYIALSLHMKDSHPTI